MNIEATEIGKFFPNGTEALKSVSLEMSSGVLGMIGPNGAGKTTLLRILATLLEPSSGSVKLFGMDSPQMDRAICRRIGYVPQQIHLVDDLSARENIELFYDLRHIQSPSRKRWINEHLELTGLASIAHTRAGSLSGGERRKLGFALGILHRPDLLICDEITTGLDPGERVFFRNLLAEIGEHICVIFSTHILEDIASAADQLCVMVAGRMEFSGKPHDLIESQASRIWQIDVDEERIPELEGRFLVTDQRPFNGHVRLKLISSEPPPGSVTAECRFEDAFLALLPREKHTEFLTNNHRS